MKLTPKHIIQKKQGLWILMSILAVGCSSSSSTTQKLDGGATPTALQLKVAKKPVAAATALSSEEATNMTIASGQACVSEIRLKAPEGLSCADLGFVEQSNIICKEESETEDSGTVVETQIEIAGPVKFDLVTGESTPSLADLKIPSGIYRKIEFRFDKNCDGSDVNIQLGGSVKDSSNVDHSFAMDLKYEDDIKIESSDDVPVVEGDTNQLFATLFLSQWFENVDLVGCIESGDLAADGSGIVQINDATVGAGSCDKIYEDILDGIKDGFEFGGEHSSDDGATTDNNGVDANDSPDSTLVK